MTSRLLLGTCKVATEVNTYFQRCNKFYQIDLEETRDFNIGWKLENNETVKRSKREILRDFLIHDQRKNIDKIPNHLVEAYKLLKRERRALRVRVNRKTSITAGVFGKNKPIKIDSQYLLPDGRVKTNLNHWKHHGAIQLRGFPYFGRFSLYGGGGYIAELNKDIDYAQAVAASLEQDAWIDLYTRAIFFEFSVFSVGTQYFGTGFIIAEVLPTGQIVPNGEVRVFRLNRYAGAGGKLILASEIILLLLFFLFIYREVHYMKTIGFRSYFKGFWCWIELIITISLFTGIILWIIRWYQGDQNLYNLKKNHDSFISFQYAAAADEMLNTAVTVIVFFSTLKIIKLISIFPMIVALKGVIRKSLKPISNYFLPFTIAFIAFGMFANLMFYNLYVFSSMIRTAETQFHMLLGGSVFKSFRGMNQTFVSLYFSAFVIFETFILMNIFVSILNESIAECSSSIDLQKEDLEFIDFAYARFLDVFHYCFPAPSKKVQQRKSVVSMAEQKSIQRKPSRQQSRKISSVENSTRVVRFKLSVVSELGMAGKFEDFKFALERMEFCIRDYYEEQDNIYKEKLLLLSSMLEKKTTYGTQL